MADYNIWVHHPFHFPWHEAKLYFSAPQDLGKSSMIKSHQWDLKGSVISFTG